MRHLPQSFWAGQEGGIQTRPDGSAQIRIQHEIRSFYQLPCAPDQSELDRYQQTLEQIEYADALGFDTAWLAELHFNRPFRSCPRR